MELLFQIFLVVRQYFGCITLVTGTAGLVCIIYAEYSARQTAVPETWTPLVLLAAGALLLTCSIVSGLTWLAFSS